MKKMQNVQDLLRFSKMKLYTKIAMLISVLLIVIFSILILVTVLSTQKSIEHAVTSEFSQISRSNSLQVQEVIDIVSRAVKDMDCYLQKYYVQIEQGTAQSPSKEKSIQNQTISSLTPNNIYYSSIYHNQITEINADVEKYLISTARSAATNNPDIIGMGTFFEPYKFDPTLKDYGFYIEKGDGDAPVKPFGTYEEYSKDPDHMLGAKEKKFVFTSPYEYDGVTMVSAVSPIMYNNEFRGVIIADMNVSNFSKYDTKDSKYKSMFSMIYDDKGLIIYESGETKNIGKSMSEFYKNKKDYEFVKKSFTKGKSFRLEIKTQDAGALTCFFNPIKVGDTFWWEMTALSTKELNKEVQGITIWMIIISIFALLIIVIIINIVLKRMLNPIQSVVQAAESIARGNFNIQLEEKSHDEIGMLSRTFNKTSETLKFIISDISRVLNNIANKNLAVETDTLYEGDLAEINVSLGNIIISLNQVIGNINQSSEQVLIGSEQVSSGAQALSQGATEQASAIEELFSSINTISGEIKRNSENAHNANNVTMNAMKEIQENNEQMKEMIDAIHDINNKSTEIYKIIKAIEDIAFQTNILALNAAVEAARAGSAGKGFAVVADEVRNLASKSAESAKSTTLLIEETMKAVENGTRIAEKTAESMLHIVKGTKEATDLVEEIAQASRAQATSTAEVSIGLEQISGVVQTNSATAEESAAASEQLMGQAMILKELVSQFTLTAEQDSSTKE